MLLMRFERTPLPISKLSRKRSWHFLKDSLCQVLSKPRRKIRTCLSVWHRLNEPKHSSKEIFVATGKNGREVGRVSIRVLPNMDNFRRLAEKQISNTKPLSVDVEADMSHFERDMERKTRKRSTTVNVVAYTQRFYNHLKKATSLAPSVKVAVEAVPTNFKVPEVPDLQLKINDSAALKQLSQFSNKLVKESRKWQVNAPSLGVTGKAPNVPKTSVNQVFSEDDFLKPLAIIKQIHAELGKRARAKVLDDLNRGLDFVTSKAGDARKAFRMVYAYKFKPRYVDPFTEPFAKGAANARRF